MSACLGAHSLQVVTGEADDGEATTGESGPRTGGNLSKQLGLRKSVWQ